MSNTQALIEPEVVRFVGVLDAWRAPSVGEAFGQITIPQSVIIDLERVTFIDSAGLAALIGGIRQVRRLGGNIALCAPSRLVTKVFKMTGVDRLAIIAATHLEAVAALEVSSGQPEPA